MMSGGPAYMQHGMAPSSQPHQPYATSNMPGNPMPQAGNMPPYNYQ